METQVEARLKQRVRARPVAALVVVLLGAALPLWAYLGHIDDIADLRERLPTFDGLGRSWTQGAWSPLPDDKDTIVSLRIEQESGGDTNQLAAEIDQALTSEGFRQWRHYDNYRRSNGRNGPGWSGYDIATVEVINDREATVHFSTGPWNRRDQMPLWVFLGTVLLAAAVGLASPKDQELSPNQLQLRRVIGQGLLGLTAVQGGLLIRALWLAKTRLESYVAEFGPIQDIYSTTNPELGLVRFEVSNLTTPLYPFGSATILILLPLWIIGGFVGFDSYRIRLCLLGAGALAITATLLLFPSTSELVVDILD